MKLAFHGHSRSAASLGRRIMLAPMLALATVAAPARAATQTIIPATPTMPGSVSEAGAPATTQPVPLQAPEIHPGLAASGVFLIVCGALVVAGRRRVRAS